MESALGNRRGMKAIFLLLYYIIEEANRDPNSKGIGHYIK